MYQFKLKKMENKTNIAKESIRSKIEKLINENLSKKEVFESLSDQNFKPQTVKWYYYQLKNKKNEPIK